VRAPRRDTVTPLSVDVLKTTEKCAPDPTSQVRLVEMLARSYRDAWWISRWGTLR